MNAPRYHDLMHVLVGSSVREQRRRGHNRLVCKLTWEQILETLGEQRGLFNLKRYPSSRRSLGRWLSAMERFRFFHRDTHTHRDRAGRILWRLTTFHFAKHGILWIKKYWDGGSALLARSIVPKVAVRLKSVEDLKNSGNVDQLSTNRDPRSRGGADGPPKSAALRRRSSSTTRSAAPPPKKSAIQKRTAKRATIAPAARNARGRSRPTSRRRRRS